MMVIAVITRVAQSVAVASQKVANELVGDDIEIELQRKGVRKSISLRWLGCNF
jgi:hypothetical protein